MEKKKTGKVQKAIIIAYFIFIAVSFAVDFDPGKQVGMNFWMFFVEMMKIIPFAFILIGLFEVWVERETVEKHLGHGGGIKSYMWAILLGGATIGTMIVALPVSFSLYKKGARLSVLFTYLGAAAVCRIPMTIFEASFLGAKFTIIRYAVSVPLIIITSIILGRYLEKKKYKIEDYMAESE